ncbi:MAG: WYL domain-containing protein [Pseudoalteromonas sp.]
MTPQFDYICQRRFHFIELIVHWEGRLTTNHLQKHFAISRSSASNIIQDYVRFHPDFLRYNSSLKGYQATEYFNPCLNELDLSAYLKIAKQSEDTVSWQQFTWLNSPLADIAPKKVRGVLQALNSQLRVDVGYASVSSPDFEARIISPHNLVFDGMRWHVRAYCEKNRDFRDFVLTRFNGEYEFVFPVLTGLNRTNTSHESGCFCVPRTHGAEPIKQHRISKWLVCSPYPRG